MSGISKSENGSVTNSTTGSSEVEKEAVGFRPTSSAADDVAIVTGGPIVFDRAKKKKARYSRSLKDIQVQLKDVTKAYSRVMSAVTDGIKEYRKRADKSSRKKRDGMLKDIVRNSARGISKVLRSSARLPEDLAKMYSGKRTRRGVVRFARLFSR